MLKKTEEAIKNELSRGTRQHWAQDTERRQTKQKKHHRKLKKLSYINPTKNTEVNSCVSEE
jgi:hypothetical protein